MVEAFPFDSAPKYLLRERDWIYGDELRKQGELLSIKEVLSGFAVVPPNLDCAASFLRMNQILLDLSVQVSLFAGKTEGDISASPSFGGNSGSWTASIGSLIAPDEPDE
jgi:hypothetical protein